VESEAGDYEVLGSGDLYADLMPMVSSYRAF